MKEKLHNWINNIHMVLVLIPAIPIFLDVQNQKWIALIPMGLIILIQCFQYVSVYDIQEAKGEDFFIYNLCIVGKVILFTLYIIVTDYWIFSPLYYVIINPKNKKVEKISLVFIVLSVLLVWFPKLRDRYELPWFLLSVVIVWLITLLLRGMEEIVKRIIRREYLLEEQMKIVALNELKLNNLNRELVMKYQLIDTNARLEERENMARNIHNVVGHTITSYNELR